ncbi:hypothetical protein AOC36_00375 [Erysipelothrix larvae]|uniref:VanZ-like domain-containing protein n=1 Tax=Erysipelothrix larvae TaxID=1514105 RepID=A0A0X8GXZ8_9FIRM|nr:VanZ family protein [Erysipelothrix larvae]AMC92502.1 hypothetical protein AOC36_00375 [Erysipelothrix larvae]
MDFCFDCAAPDYQITTGILIYIGLYILLWLFKVRHLDIKHRFYVAMLFCFTAVALDLTLFPLSKYSMGENTFAPNLEFFRFITEILTYRSWQVLKLTVFNVLLFIPIGYYGKKVFKTLNNFKLILLFLMFSLFIETTQALCSWLGYSYRIFDVDDLMVNVLGGIIGLILAYIPFKIVKRWMVPPFVIKYPIIIDLFGLVLMIVMCYLGNHIIY